MGREQGGGSTIITGGRSIFLCNLERRFMGLIKMRACYERSQRGLAAPEPVRRKRGGGGLFIG